MAQCNLTYTRYMYIGMEGVFQGFFVWRKYGKIAVK